jgi:putative DNA primase/helicase
MTKLSDLARGHWRMLLPALGVDSKFLKNSHGPCPICGGADRFRWDNQHDGGGYICNSCGAGDGFNLASKVTGKPFVDIAAEVERLLGVERPILSRSADPEEVQQRNAMRRLWEGSGSPSEDGLVSGYLRARIGRPWPSNALREHTGIFSDGRSHPAMVAKVVTHDDRAVNLHITLLTVDGQKASVEKQRRVMPGKLPDGCAIRLSPAAEVMGVAEGIETALSASIMYGVPVWACINKTILAKWEPPKIARRILIFADNDVNFSGQAKAYHLANRLVVQHKLDAEVLIPPEIGEDWNDVHRSTMPKPSLRLVK